MADIQSTNDLVSAAWYQSTVQKASITSVAGFHYSLLTSVGFPIAGSVPATGAGAAATNTTAGSLKVPSALGAGENLFLGQVSLGMQTIGTLILYDRLWHTSGLNGTLTTAQTVGTGTLPRYATGDGVELWLEWYTATGSTVTNVTASFTRQDGTAGQTTTSLALPASVPANRMYQLPLPSGSTGVRSVESVTLSASTLTAGNFGVTLLKRLAVIPIQIAGTGQTLDFFQLGKLNLASSTATLPSLWFMILPSTTTTGVISGQISTLVK